MMRKRVIFSGLAAVALLAMLAPATRAGPLADAAAKVEALAQAGDIAGADALLRDAIGSFAQTLPFSIGKAVFVKTTPAGFGMYDAASDAAFAEGESIMSYIEPIGLTWTKATDPAKLQTRFTVDFDILNPAGEILATQKAFGDFTFTSLIRNQEIYANMTIDVTGAPAGDYVLRFHFNDINSGRTTSIDQAFSIVAP